MKAVLLTSHGGPEMLRYGEAPDPTAGLGEVVVDVYAASVNAADSKVRQGGGRYTLNQFPHILGRDFSGVVSTVSSRVPQFDYHRGTSVYPFGPGYNFPYPDRPYGDPDHW